MRQQERRFYYDCTVCETATHVPLSDSDRQDPPDSIRFRCPVCESYTERHFVRERLVTV